MDNTFILFDTNSELVDLFKKEFAEYENIVGIDIDVYKLVDEYNIDIIVSPANSLGMMNGGIDACYSKMFPDIQNKVQTAIRQYNIKIGVFYILPVGSAIVVNTETESCKYLICAPTMITPGNISNTLNVYHAFTAILNAVKTYKNMVIAIPGLGTGVGKVTPKQCVMQMKQAYVDFCNNKSNINQNNILVHKPS